MVASVQPEKMRPEFLRRVYNFFVEELRLENSAQGSAVRKRAEYRRQKRAKAAGGQLVDHLDTLRIKDEISSIVSNPVPLLSLWLVLACFRCRIDH